MIRVIATTNSGSDVTVSAATEQTWSNRLSLRSAAMAPSATPITAPITPAANTSTAELNEPRLDQAPHRLAVSERGAQLAGEQPGEPAPVLRQHALVQVQLMLERMQPGRIRGPAQDGEGRVPGRTSVARNTMTETRNRVSMPMASRRAVSASRGCSFRPETACSAGAVAVATVVPPHLGDEVSVRLSGVTARGWSYRTKESTDIRSTRLGAVLGLYMSKRAPARQAKEDLVERPDHGKPGTRWTAGRSCGASPRPARWSAPGACSGACSSSSSSGQAAASPTSTVKRRGGALKVGLTGGSGTDTLDPHKGLTYLDTARAQSLYQPLLQLNTQPRRNSSWPRTSPARLDVQLGHQSPQGHHLPRRQAVTADDVNFTIRRIVSGKLTGATPLGPIDLKGLKALTSTPCRCP